MRLAPFGVLALYAALAPGTAWAWGQDGHRIIAAIAASRLNSSAVAQVQSLLEEGETLVSIAAWADQVRPDRPESSTWHYINLTITESRTPGSKGQWKQSCQPAGCVASILGEMLTRVKDRGSDRSRRAEALKFLVHFVADLHQPLHAGDLGDQGGNAVPVVYSGRAGNLHSIWDTALLRDWLTRPAVKARLAKGPGFWAARSMRGGTVDDWIWESHDVARDVAYRHLPSSRPAVLGPAYLTAAGPAITLQLERAGVRLARLLNEALSR